MNGPAPRLALVVGGYGDLGTVISDRLRRDGYQLLRASRRERPDVEAVVLDPAGFAALPVLDAVCWAQGANVNDGVDGFDDADLAALFDANVAGVARQLRDLLAAGRISDGASLVVISSIWQNIARQERKIRNRAGMHARAAVKFVQLAAHFKSEITVLKEGTGVNGKSIMGLLTLVAALGVTVVIEATGPDAEEAASALGALVDNGFGEGVVDD